MFNHLGSFLRLGGESESGSPIKIMTELVKYPDVFLRKKSNAGGI